MKGGNVLLDVDLDYFARYRKAGLSNDWSRPWTDPFSVVTELHDRVPRAEVTTVSMSWHGGYVPTGLQGQVFPLTEGSEQIEGGDVWDHLDERFSSHYSDYTQACGLLHRKRPAEAMPFALRAVATAPDVGAYHYAVALCEASIGNLKGAIHSVDRCLSSDSLESSQVLNDMAGIHVRLGELDDALLLQERAFAIDQAGSPIISGNLMALCAQVGQWDRAQDLAEVTLKRQPFNAEAHVIMATAAQLHGDDAAAVQAWERAARAAPGDAMRMAWLKRSVRLKQRMKEK